MKEVQINGNNITIEEVHFVARENAKVSITDDARKKVQRCREMIQSMVDSGKAIYGVTTGIGELARIKISQEQGAELQKRIIYSHSASVGNPFPISNVRAAMLLRANTLSKGHSAVRIELVETLMNMLNRGVTPFVREKGSVGASGDLSPLSMIAEVVIGEGQAYYQGELLPGRAALEKAGIPVITPSFKEGLGLINGCQMFTGTGALALYDAKKIIKNSIISSAFSIDTLKAPVDAYDARVHKIRPYNGQQVVAAHLRKLLEGSKLTGTRNKVQDAYSLRCTPQIQGPTIDTYNYVIGQTNVEMNAVADNPLFFPDDNTYLAAGNFHGQAMAMALDFMGIAIAELASLSERHTNRLLNPVLSDLPDFLVEGQGLNSGLMVAQYSAAALVSENKVLSHPAVVDSISVSADQEDHVSMGPIAARKLTEIVRNTEEVISIELMCAAQAADFIGPEKLSKTNKIVYDKVRTVVDRLIDDRPLHPDIHKITELVRSGEIIEAIEKEVGNINFEL